jgi:hypothetical protein
MRHGLQLCCDHDGEVFSPGLVLSDHDDEAVLLSCHHLGFHLNSN